MHLHPGMTIDGFELVEPLHEGGMATLWRVRHPDHPGASLMKLPRIGYGEAATQIVGFEVERMILQCPQQYLWGYNRYKGPRREPEDESPAGSDGATDAGHRA